MTAHWLPSFEEKILGRGRPADQRQSSAKRSPSLFIFADDVRDKEAGGMLEEGREAAGGGGGRRSARILLQKIWLFLPLCEHVDEEKKNAQIC